MSFSLESQEVDKFIKFKNQTFKTNIKDCVICSNSTEFKFFQLMNNKSQNIGFYRPASMKQTCFCWYELKNKVKTSRRGYSCESRSIHNAPTLKQLAFLNFYKISLNFNIHSNIIHFIHNFDFVDYFPLKVFEKIHTRQMAFLDREIKIFNLKGSEMVLRSNFIKTEYCLNCFEVKGNEYCMKCFKKNFKHTQDRVRVMKKYPGLLSCNATYLTKQDTLKSWYDIGEKIKLFKKFKKTHKRKSMCLKAVMDVLKVSRIWALAHLPYQIEKNLKARNSLESPYIYIFHVRHILPRLKLLK